MKVRSVVGRGAAVLSVGTLATAGLVFAVSGGAGAQSTEKSFEDVGEHSWTVPAGICSLWVEAKGAQGGDAISEGPDVAAAAPAPPPVDPTAKNEGGLGGEAKAHIVVTPGETLEVNVGGRGGDALNEKAGKGGDNGGADGGTGGTNTDDESGAGGGGASDVRQGGDELENRVVVAGGGGGAGGGIADTTGTDASEGGDGGGKEGDDGKPAFGAVSTQAGEGGSQSEGGDGGIIDPSTSNRNGEDGDLGDGGEGGGFDPQFAIADGGGGGGGGLYGGGGGASSRSDAGDTFVDGAGGGGGSGFGPEGTDFETGTNKGDGEVTISYDPVADACAAAAVVAEPKFTG
jgi:hypothetical protein